MNKFRKLVIIRSTEDDLPIEPMVTWRDDLWFIVPMMFAFVAFAAWRLTA